MKSKNMIKLFSLLIVVACATQFTACSHAQKVDFPKKKKKVTLRGKRIVVSRFVILSQYSKKDFLYNSGRYDTYRITTKRVPDDVSRKLVYYLKRHGIRARYAKKIRPGNLKRNEVLLTGMALMKPKPTATPINVVGIVIGIGSILPNPLGFSLGADVKYRYVFINSRKNILFRSGIQEGEVYYKWYYIWSVLGYQYQSYFKEAQPRAIAEIFKDVRNTLK